MTETKYIRPSWDEYFIEVMDAVSKRGTCDRGRTAAVIVRNNTILATGYVGAPKGSPHCDDVGHMLKKTTHGDGRETTHCVRTGHGESNAIAQAAKQGASTDGATIYTRFYPCHSCAILIVNCGIVRVVVQKEYHASEQSKEVFRNAGVEVLVMTDEMQTYKDM